MQPLCSPTLAFFGTVILKSTISLVLGSRVTSVLSSFIHEPTSIFCSENCLHAKAPPVEGVESVAYINSVFLSALLLITRSPSLTDSPGVKP